MVEIRKLVFKYFLLKPNLRKFIREKDKEVADTESFCVTICGCAFFVIVMCLLAVVRG